VSKGKKGRQIAHHIGKQLNRNYRKKLKGYAKNEYDKPQQQAGDALN
jgi:hypothetical protein